MSRTEAPRHVNIQFVGDGYEERLRCVITTARLPYGNSRMEQVRKFLGMESQAEKKLRRQLCHIVGVDSPDLNVTRFSPRRSGITRYEFSTHLRDRLPGSFHETTHNSDPRSLVTSTVKSSAKAVMLDAFGWTDSNTE